MFYPGFYFDPTYFLVLIGAVISIAASTSLNSTFTKYSRVKSSYGLTGAEVAQRILRMAGINDVQVERVGGSLTDHYDPSHKRVRLSDSVYGSTSVAAFGVAAHECGHAIQHQVLYAPLTIRARLVPLANIGSMLGIPIILIGLFISAFDFLIPIGIWVFSLAVLFQIVTLPVEFNASARAVRILEDSGMVGGEELTGVRKVLKAAALTYVAAAAASILQLLRLVLLFGGRRDND